MLTAPARAERSASGPVRPAPACDARRRRLRAAVRLRRDAATRPKRLDLAALKQALEPIAAATSPRATRPAPASPTRPRCALTEWVAIREHAEYRLRPHRRLPARGAGLARRRADPAPSRGGAPVPAQAERGGAGLFRDAAADHVGRQVRACSRLQGRRARPRRRGAHPRDLAQGRVRQGVRGEGAREVSRRADAGGSPLPHGAPALQGELGRGAKGGGASGRRITRRSSRRGSARPQAKKAGALLDAVPATLRSDSSYVFSRAQWLRRKNKPVEAATVDRRGTRDPALLVDGDEWWTERRIIARKLLDNGDAKTAYEVASRHGAGRAQKRIEAEFHAGWIALRFLNEPAAAATHFAPTAADRRDADLGRPRRLLAGPRRRGGRGPGRGEALLRARRRTARSTYYGQLARAKLGNAACPARAPDPARAAARPSSAAAAAGPCGSSASRRSRTSRSRSTSISRRRLNEPAQLEALGDLAAEQEATARALARRRQVGGAARLPARYSCLSDDRHPELRAGRRARRAGDGLRHRPAGERVRPEGRQSSAGARGLMQLMPATAKRTAKRFGLGFDTDKPRPTTRPTTPGSARPISAS